jgi:hypothetical protein
MSCQPHVDPSGTAPAGTVIDDPRCFWLVRQGVAEPIDEECAVKAGMSPESFAAARRAYERTEKGIHPDDFAAYDAGEMVGYDNQEDPIPGPNARYEGALVLPEEY